VKPLRFQREATDELDEAVAWYNSQQAGLGLAFFGSVQLVLDSIIANPKSGFCKGKKSYRFCPTERFPYVVYWLEVNDAIRILAIAHAKRRPNYWRHRISEQ